MQWRRAKPGLLDDRVAFDSASSDTPMVHGQGLGRDDPVHHTL